MANEIRVNSLLTVRKGNCNYQTPPPQGFVASMAGQNGPTPGAVTISVNGTSISLSQLTAMGGMCELTNIDLTNTIGYGVRETSSGKYFELGMLLPGESYVIRLSDKLSKEEVGTGTFTANQSTLFCKARVAAAILRISAFDP